MRLRSLDSVSQWFFQWLFDSNEDNWQQTAVEKQYLHDEFHEFCIQGGLKSVSLPIFCREFISVFGVIQELRPSGPGRRPRCYELPPLEELRRRFATYVGEGEDLWNE